MKRLFLVLLCLFSFPIAASFATPPTSITLSYDQAQGSLRVEAEHPSFDINKSYVRLMNIYVNGEQIFTQDYFRQDSPEKFIQDVPVNVQVGDVIKVDLFCTLGGEMAKELTVTKPEKE